MQLAIGTQVIILPYAEYRDKYRGFIGTVERVTGLAKDKIGVAFENVRNDASSYGVFWFSANKVEIIESEESIDMLQGFVTAGVKFLDGTNSDTEYFYALYDENICTGDTVVVKTGHHGFALAVVSSIGEHGCDVVKCGREIVDRVDFTAYNDRCNRVKRLAELRSTLNDKVREYQQNAIYEMIAEKDPAMKPILDEYKAILGL